MTYDPVERRRVEGRGSRLILWLALFALFAIPSYLFVHIQRQNQSRLMRALRAAEAARARADRKAIDRLRIPVAVATSSPRFARTTPEAAEPPAELARRRARVDALEGRVPAFPNAGPAPRVDEAGGLTVSGPSH